MAYNARVAIDLLNVHKTAKGGGIISTLAWGDPLRVRGPTAEGGLAVGIRILGTGRERATIEEVVGYVKPPLKKSGLTADDLITRQAQQPGVLKVDFVDVQQGDGAVVETAGGKVMFIDGGRNQLFARYVAARYRGSSDARPKTIDCLVVTHGDADHFSGLTRIHDSETYTSHNPDAGARAEEERQKRLFIHPLRVYHNGLVKRPGKLPNKKSRPEEDMLGGTARAGGRRYVTGLVNDLRTASPAVMNKQFQEWRAALRAWANRGKFTVRRIARPINGPGNRDVDAFDFLADEGVTVDILGPLEHQVNGHAALPFLGTPQHKAERQPGQPQVVFRGESAGHTINGHSIVLRLIYGNFRFLFAGDLNEESEQFLTAEHQAGRIDLTSEIFKVPHHGSADFSVPFLQAVSPAVSVISSGDESAFTEYAHPRATLVGGLSKQGRPTLEEPLILMTELAAFFKVEGWVVTDPKKVTHTTQVSKRKNEWFAFSRPSFGIIKVRTDGQRLLVFTYSGKESLREAYAFRLQGDRVIPEPVRKH